MHSMNTSLLVILRIPGRAVGIVVIVIGSLRLLLLLVTLLLAFLLLSLLLSLLHGFAERLERTQVGICNCLWVKHLSPFTSRDIAFTTARSPSAMVSAQIEASSFELS